MHRCSQWRQWALRNDPDTTKRLANLRQTIGDARRCLRHFRTSIPELGKSLELQIFLRQKRDMAGAAAKIDEFEMVVVLRSRYGPCISNLVFTEQAALRMPTNPAATDANAGSGHWKSLSAVLPLVEEILKLQVPVRDLMRMHVRDLGSTVTANSLVSGAGIPAAFNI